MYVNQINLRHPYKLSFQAIHHLDNHRTNRLDFATILDATRGIVFLGTPHRGTGATTLPKLIAFVVQAFQDVNMGLIQDVEMESQTLDRIGDSFGQILDRQRLTVFSFEEELPMPLGRKVCAAYMPMTQSNSIVFDQVVEGGSAIIGYPSERRDTIYADHVNMVKFSDRMDDGYKKILHAIKVLLEEKQKSTGQGMPIYDIYYMVPYVEQIKRKSECPSRSPGTMMSRPSTFRIMLKEGSRLLDSMNSSQIAALPFHELWCYSEWVEPERHNSR